MDTRDGRILTTEEVEKMLNNDSEAKQHLMNIKISPTAKQLARTPPRIGRNEPCPCGSGNKFKKCCLTRS